MSCLSKSLVWFGGIGASLILAYGSLYLFYNYQHDNNDDDDDEKNRGFHFLWPKSSTSISENGSNYDDLSYEIIASDSDSSIDIIIMYKQVPTIIFERKIGFEKIQQKTCTLIEAKSSSNVCPIKYRDISIQGYTKNVMQASRMIENLIESTPLVESKRFEIPAQMLPLITGIKRTTLKSLCSRSGAEILINQDKNDDQNRSTTTILDIMGTKEQIKRAYDLIFELLNQEQLSKNGSKSTIKYSNNHETHAADLFVDYPELSNRSIVSLTNEQLIYMTETFDCFDAEFQQQKNPTTTIQPPIPIYVSHVIDPTNFYIQIIGDKRSTRLDALLNEMKEFYDQEENQKSCQCNDRLSSNDLVAIRATDGQYYRGYVVENGSLHASESEKAPDSMIRVFFADLGMTCWHAKQNLFYLNANFLNKLPFQAINCCLYEFSNDSYNPDYQWTKELLDDFREFTCEGLWEPVISVRNHGRVDDDLVSYPSKRAKFLIEMFRKLPNDPAMMTINVGKQLLFKK